MLNKNKKIFPIFLAAAFLLLGADVYAQPVYTTRIAWPAVEGVSGYIVEIKNSSGKQVYRQKTETNVIRPSLPAGEYQIKVITIDLFGREASSSEWASLSVIKSEIPVFTAMNPPALKAGTKADTVEISGGNFMEGCTVRLVLDGTVIKAEKLEMKSSSKILCSFDLTNAPEGAYSVIIENPAGKVSDNGGKVIVSAEKTDALPLAGNGSPVIKNIAPASFFTGSGNVEIEISGENLDKNSVVVFSSGSAQVTCPVKKADGRNLVAEFPEAGALPGLFDATVTNDGRSSAVKSALKIKDRKNGYLGLHGLYVGLGYDAMMVLPAWNAVLKNGFAGGSLYVGHSLDGLFNAGWLRFFGLEASAGFSYFSTKKIVNKRSGNLAFMPASAGMYCRIIPFVSQLDILLRINGGAAGSYLSVSGGGISKSVFSVDPVCSAGGAIRYTFNGLHYAEVGSDYIYSLYRAEPLSGVKIFMRAGFRL